MPGEAENAIGWTWEIRREHDQPRQVRVEITRQPFVPTELPEETRNAIRSRGATAVDAFLHLNDPPERITVSTHGIHAPSRPAESIDTPP
jgi:hypothetical protein